MREHLKEPIGFVNTPFGEMEYHFWDSCHAVLCSHPEITVNGVTYTARADLKFIDGQWQFENFNDLYLHRPGKFYPKDAPSPAARNKVRNTLPNEWTQFLQNYPNLPQEADRISHNNMMARLEEEINGRQEEVNKLRNQLAELENRVAVTEMRG